MPEAFDSHGFRRRLSMRCRGGRAIAQEDVMFVNQRLVARAGVVGFAAALLVLPQTTAAAGAQPPAPRMIGLPVPANVTASDVTGGDHTGRHLAGMGLVLTETGSTTIPLQWVDGRVRIVDTSAVQPYANISVADVNSHGVVVGSRMTGASFSTDAWVYRAGRARLLPALQPGDETRALAINARGDVVGMDARYADGIYRTWAVLWPADRPGTVRELVVTGETPERVTAVDIDDDGTVLGFVGGEPTADQHPYVWPARGTGYPLAAPEGTGYPKGVAVHAGQVVGYAVQWEGDMGFFRAVRWNLRSGTSEIVTPTTGSAVAVNRQGMLASTNTVVYPDGRALDLGGFIRVLSDHRTAAGTTAEFMAGSAVVWVGL
jgi:uncharacterized membrane protein